MHCLMIDPDIPPPIVQAVVNRCGIISIRKLTSGLSGGTVAHCRATDGCEYALKRWPDSYTRSRIESIHQVIGHAWKEGCEIIAFPVTFPQLTRKLPADSVGTVLSANGEYWDLSHWRPGKPLTTTADLDTIRRGAAAISRFHSCTASLGSLQQPPPIIAERLQTLASRTRHFPIPTQSINHADLPTDVTAALRDAANLLQWKWDEACAQIHRSLTEHSGCKLATQYVLRDVHAEHLLFSAEKPTGLIDFDAVRVDTPASDLARWAGSFLPGPHAAEDVWDAVFAGYRENTAQTDNAAETPTVKLAADLCFAGTWLSLANWLVWLLVERRDFDAPPGILAERIYNLIRVATPRS
ncbi:MAG: hypothetical protein CMM05_05685 [Rhodopirellula sp.]|nr:hypothetical protein [Rhodopirellula sp.]